MLYTNKISSFWMKAKCSLRVSSSLAGNRWKRTSCVHVFGLFWVPFFFVFPVLLFTICHDWPWQATLCHSHLFIANHESTMSKSWNHLQLIMSYIKLSMIQHFFFHILLGFLSTLVLLHFDIWHQQCSRIWKLFKK